MVMMLPHRYIVERSHSHAGKVKNQEEREE